MTDRTMTAANVILNALPSTHFVSWTWLLATTRKSACSSDSMHAAMRMLREDNAVEFKDGKYRQRTADEFKS